MKLGPSLNIEVGPSFLRSIILRQACAEADDAVAGFLQSFG